MKELNGSDKYWKRYVNNTFSVTVGTIDYFMSVLNSYNVTIQWTFEAENESKLKFDKSVVNHLKYQ